MKFTEWLIEELKKRNWSQSELARKGNISPAMVSMVLSETTKPGANFCTGVAQALNMPPEAVMRKANILKRVGPMTQNEELKRAVETLDEEDAKHLLYIAKALAERKSVIKDPETTD